ncbi:hypothetical protein [Ralstonia solanacearum]|uniref:hypothetical protein n=1 Tax=Ralstonia solanacearum TaxID=305 RepID=UPI000B27519A|nr:hypothetical protein [Ralstonia solanacearum]
MQRLDGNPERIGSSTGAGRFRHLVRAPHKVLQSSNFPEQPADDRVVAAALTYGSELGV